MIRRKILVIASYPIVNPQHGGQKRVKALVDFYQNIFQSVMFIGVYPRDFYKDHGEDDILLGQPNILEACYATPYASDVISGMAIDKDIHVRSPLAEVIRNYQPDIIHIEQVFPYLGLKVLLKELGASPKIIFGSQNIEYRMKESIYESIGAPEDVRAEFVRQIKEAEETLSRNADLVIAVSEDDAKVHRKMGAKKCVVAPNGIDKIKPTADAKAYWEKFKKRHKISCAITFVGSGHPPNWTGFLDMLGHSLDYVPAGARIILAGGVADYFSEAFAYSKNRGFWRKAIAVGKLDEDLLAGLLYSSDILLLPITSGGGSNLKTAEALLSGHKIVATEYAFRSYEKYVELPNVYLASSADLFQKNLVTAISSEYVPRTSDQAHLAEQVQWQYCLAPLLPELRKLSYRITFESLVRNAFVVPRKTGRLLRRVVKKFKVGIQKSV